MHSMTNETGSVPLALHLHGYPTVHLNGRVATLPLKHGLALLAYLADHAHPVGRDTLATLLWPDAAPGVGRTRLRRLVHTLHERIGCTLVRGDHDALWLLDPVRSDLRDTESAVARVLLGHALDVPALAPLLKPEAGHVLAGFALDSDAFEDWLEQRRRVQHSRLVRALQRAVELARAVHDRVAAHAAALALLRLEPHNALPLAA
jgi:DNA-binding SARP family transcriptional activator